MPLLPVCLKEMKTEPMGQAQRLEAGQIWKLEDGYIYIVEMGERVIQYKLLRQPNQRMAVTRMIGIEALANYLKYSDAELVPESGLSQRGGKNVAAPAIHSED